MCVGGWTHATIVTDPHRGALEQDRCEAEIAALKAKKAFLVLKLRGARAREWLRQNRGRRHMRSIELCKNLEHAPAVVRAPGSPTEGTTGIPGSRIPAFVNPEKGACARTTTRVSRAAKRPRTEDAKGFAGAERATGNAARLEMRRSAPDRASRRAEARRLGVQMGRARHVARK